MLAALNRRFKALQQHIDELTQEKYELMRGLSTQRKVQESLEAESERFASDFNRQAIAKLDDRIVAVHCINIFCPFLPFSTKCLTVDCALLLLHRLPQLWYNAYLKEVQRCLITPVCIGGCYADGCAGTACPSIAKGTGKAQR